MDRVLAQLRAAAEPTRLRLLALCARGAFCVSDLCEVLGQSQPRLSRHLKLLVEAGLLERVPEGANAYFGLPPDADLARLILARLPEDDPLLAADRRAGGPAGGGAGAGSLRRLPPPRRRLGRDARPRPARRGDRARRCSTLLPPRIGAFLDIGTGTGRLLELVAPRAERAFGVDASRDMLALARARLAERGLADRCAVRQADMYRLPLPDGGFDVVALADGAALRRGSRRRAGRGRARAAARTGCWWSPTSRRMSRAELLERHAHRWPGFDDAALAGWLGAAGCAPLPPARPWPAPLPVRLWPARRMPGRVRRPSALTF